MRREGAGLAACLLVGACQVGPAFRPPTAPVPQAWDTAADMAGWPAADWWTAFGSAQLDRLMTRGMAGNLDVAAATARIAEADAQSRQAGAALLPTLGVNTSNGVTRDLNQVGRERHRVFLGGVFQASYQLDFWGKNPSAALAARAAGDAARYARQVVLLSTQSAVASTYFGYLGLRQQLDAAERDLGRQQRLLSGLATLQAAGAVPLFTVVQQRTAVDAFAATLPPLRQRATQMHTALAILLDTLPEALLLQPERLSDLTPPPATAGLPSQLLLRRPDVRQADATLRAANADVRVAQAAFYPSLDLTANGGIAAYLLTHSTAGPLGVYSLAAQLTQPIFEGGLLRGQLEYAQAVYREDLQDYQKTALSAFSDVENALDGVRETAMASDEQAQSSRSAQTGADMAQEGFHAGTTTILDVLNAEGALITADQSAAQAETARLQALVSLYDALGGGWLS